MGYLSFALNYRLHGYEVTGYHAVNTAVHVFSGWLVYAIGLAMLGTPRLRAAFGGRARGLASLLAAALFVAHPVQTEAVTYVFQRLASMSAMFYLLSVALYAHARDKGPGAGRTALFCLSLASAVLAMKTKETAFTLPFAIALYELAFHEGPWQRRLIWLGPFAPLLFIVPLSITAASGETAGDVSKYLSLGLYQEGYSAYEYLLTQARVVVTYMRMLLLPIGQNLDHDYPLYRSALEPGVMASTALIASLLFSSVIALRRFRSGGPAVLGVMGFGMLWFFLTLSVESSIVPIPMLMDEYRMYLPSAGWCLAMAAALASLAVYRRARASRPVIAVCVAIVLVLGIAAYKRNSVWDSRVSLWEDVVGKSPLKLRGYNNLANAYIDAGLYDRAIPAYKHALRPEIAGRASKRELAEVHYNLARAYADKDRHQEAIEHLRICIRLMPSNADAHNNLGVSLLALGRAEEAVDAYYGALRADSNYTNAYFNLGEAFHLRYLEGNRTDTSLLQRSIANYELFIALRPHKPEAYRNLAEAYADKGDARKSAEYMETYEERISALK
jgi:tetratricopeptide (TPR) repeat protein